MFYENAKEISGIKYVTINDNEKNQSDLLLFLCPTNKNITHLSIENSELVGKSYELIVADIVIYYGVVEKGKNLFPIDNFPLSQINISKINILIKDIGNENINLNVTNILTDQIEIPEKFNDELQTPMQTYPWPIQNCITCKEKTKELHKNLSANTLRVISGMCGLEYNNNCFDAEVIDTVNKKISVPPEHITALENDKCRVTIFSRKYVINMVKIKSKNSNLSCYSHNSAVLDDLIKNEKENVNVVMENVKYPLVNTDNGVFEYMLQMDAICNVEFICQDNEIEKVEFITTRKFADDDTNKINIPIPIEKTNDGYKIKTDNMALCNVSRISFIKIYTKNNNHIKIKYDNVVFGSELRRILATCESYYLIL